MKVSCSNGSAPWAVVRWRQRSAPVIFLVIGKNGSQAFLLSLTPLMRPYIVKMTWSHPKCLVHRGFDFYLVPCECGDKISHLRHTMGETPLYRAKTLYHGTFPKDFDHL
jgi:hypothetical protein